MKTISAEEAKSQLHSLFKRVRKGPAAIQENGKPVAVFISEKEYEHFKKLEDMYRAALTDEAFDRNNWVSSEKSEITLQKY